MRLIARSLGVGGGTGLGSIVYALMVMSKNLRDPGLRDDAYRLAELVTDELIAADKRLDVIGGSAGAILCLLRLYRDGQSEAVLRRAVKCGEHLLAQRRLGEPGRRSWVGQGLGSRPLNGMSHGAAGFAYALASLSAATGREDFAAAAHECVDFENSSFSPQRGNWPDLRVEGGEAWPCQWCHGAPGIGLGRIGMARLPKIAVRSWKPMFKVQSKARERHGLHPSIRCVAGHWAASNSCARRAICLDATIFKSLPNVNWPACCNTQRIKATTVGTAESGDLI